MRNLSIEFFFHYFRSSQNVLCLCAIKSRRPYISLKFSGIRPHIIFKSKILLEKSWGDFIHLLICTLSRKNDRNQKLPNIGILKRYARMRKNPTQQSKCFMGSAFPFLKAVHY